MRTSIAILALPLVTAFLSCSSQHKKNDLTKTDIFKKGERLAELKDKHLNEVSGIASSVNNPGLIWALNDSGNDPEVFLIDHETKIQHTYRLDGVKNRDWEDLFVGPGPIEGKSYLYVGEIGDNAAVYGYKHIYRFEEPVLAKGDKESVVTNFETITFSLEDSKRDTEALLMDRNTKDIYIISKWSQPVYLYKIAYPYQPGDTISAKVVGVLPHSKIVAGDISKDGSEILLKNYSHIFYWKNNGSQSIPELLQTDPLEVPYESEPQGESITWEQDNSGFYTLSELQKHEKTYLYFYRRK